MLTVEGRRGMSVLSFVGWVTYALHGQTSAELLRLHEMGAPSLFCEHGIVVHFHCLAAAFFSGPSTKLVQLTIHWASTAAEHAPCECSPALCCLHQSCDIVKQPAKLVPRRFVSWCKTALTVPRKSGCLPRHSPWQPQHEAGGRCPPGSSAPLYA